MENFKKLEKMPLLTPGEMLFEEFMKPYKISQNKLARDIDVPVSRISEIIKGERAVTADTAIRLAVYFNTSAEFWLNLQNNYDLKKLERDGEYDKILSDIRHNPDVPA